MSAAVAGWPIMTDMNDVPGPLRLPDQASPVLLWKDGACEPAQDLSGTAIFPGAFDPIHDGHRQLREAAAEFLGCPVCFELSVQNVDKAELHVREVERRLGQISSAPVLLTNAALFVDKASLFPEAWFVVGFDTAIRILDARYYRHDVRQRDQGLQQLQEAGVRFLVAGRVASASISGEFQTGEQLQVDADFRGMFVELPESCFRVDISSTVLRARRRSAPAD